MKVLRCNKCDQSFKEGKYCLDCGQPLVEVVTNEVQFNPMKTSRTADQLKRDIRKWLNRIGVQNTNIQIATGSSIAEIEYTLGRNRYRFKSVMQDNITNNLAAVEQFLHYRVIGIERGIETTEKAFAGYAALPDPSERLKAMSDHELKQELKRVHPDTGVSNSEAWEAVMAEKKRRDSEG